MKAITLDLNRITLGNLISVATMLCSLWYASVKFGADIAVIKNDVAWLKAAVMSKKPDAETLAADRR